MLGVVRILPAAFAGPLAAGLLDRVGADRLLLVAGVFRTLAIGAAGFAVAGGAGTLPVFVLVAIESLLSTMVRPLQTSALPFLARSPGELTAANLSLTTVESIGMLLGSALAGVMLTAWRPGAVLLVTAGSSAISTVLIAAIPAWRSPVSRPSSGTSFASGALSPASGRSRGDPKLRLVVGLYCAQNVVTGALNVLVVISALTILQLGESGVGELNAAIGVGGVVGAVAAVALLRRSRIASGFGIGLVLCGVPLLLIAAHPSTLPAIVLLAVLGVGVTIVDFSAVTLLQRAIHEDEMAKAFRVLQSLFVGSLGLGAAFAPVLVHWLGIRGALLASGAVLPILVALLWSRLSPLDRSGDLAEELVNLLRSIPIFAPLDLPERWSGWRAPRDSRRRPRQGGDGRRRGRGRGPLLRDPLGRVPRRERDLLASRCGRSRSGDGFGEIALLRDVPRTATVTAHTHAELYALEREHFLDAVNGSPGSREAADSMIDVRLGSLRFRSFATV